MRQGQQHRRGRSRHNNNGGNTNNNNNNNRKGQNPLTRSFESNGPDVKVRGTPAHIAEKYVSLARDAQSSGDPVLAENYLQHAEHYNRIIFTYREQQIQQGGEVPVGPASGNVHARMRLAGDPIDDDYADDEAGGDDFGHGEQPVVPRYPAEQPVPRSEGQRSDEGQHHRPQRHQDNQSRFRDRNERFQDRGERQGHGQDRQFDRPDRFNDRGERGERFDRQPQGGDRGQGDRPHGDRPQGERHDRFRDRPRFQDRRDHQQDRPDRPHQDRSGNQDRPSFQDRPPFRDRPQSDDRPSFQDRPAPERTATEQPSVPLVDRMPDVRTVAHEPVAPMPVVGERDIDHKPIVDPVVAHVADAPAPTPRRRERVVASMDQPEFLRRPVRRSRRDAEAPTAPESLPVTDEPTRE